ILAKDAATWLSLMIERRAGHQPLYIPRPLRRSMGVARAGLGDDAKRPQFGGDEAGAILGKRREGGSRRSATSRSHPTAARCSLLLTALICQDCPGVHYYTDSLIDQYLSDPPLPILEYTSDQSR